MDKTQLGSLLFLTGLIGSLIALVALIAAIIRRRGWGSPRRCLGMALLMQVLTGTVTACLGSAGLSIVFGGTFAAQNTNQMNSAVLAGGGLLLTALVLTPLLHGLVLRLFRIDPRSAIVGTVVLTTLATLGISIVMGLALAALTALGLA